MQANSIHLQRIFEQTIRYQIPLFQRPYVWSETENWLPLWEDIRALTERYLRNGTVHPHFLGAIVLDQIRGSTGSIETRQVIDGQQRLTTLQVLLSVLRDVRQVHDAQRYAARFARLTLNDESFVETDEEAFKVWPTNRDRDDFAATVRAGSAAALRGHYGAAATASHVGHRIANAYLYFERTLGTWLTGGDDEDGDGLEQFDILDRLEALWVVVRANLLLVVIDLEESDDAQVIFETLNARGTRLLPADLVKNYLFHKAEAENLPIEELYDTYWREFDGDYWRHEVKQGRIKRPRIDLFLRHYLTLVTNDDVNVGHIFGVYRFHAERDRPLSVVGGDAAVSMSQSEAHLDALRIYGEVYRTFDEPVKRSRAELFFHRLDAIDTTTVYPFLLEAFRSLKGVDDGEDLDRLLSWLESYLVRRMVCGLTPKNYNRLFLDLVRFVKRAGGISSELTRDFLLNLNGDSGRWPDDKEFRIAWMDRPIYQRLAQYKQRMVLSALDRAFEVGKSEALALPNSLTIEHVMPQNWEANWPLVLEDPEDLVERQQKVDARGRLLHSFGNLTLITGSLNPALSNAAWIDKQPELIKYSKLNLNRYFHGVERWDEDAILTRAESLLEEATNIWPYPA